MFETGTNIAPRTQVGASTLPQKKSAAFVQWRRVRTVSDSEEYQLIRAPFTTENWYDWLVEMFRKPNAETLAYREYEEARRNLLQCQRMRDYYDNMVRFETQRIKRLREMLEVHVE